MRKAKTLAVVLILFMSLGAYAVHINPTRYPPGFATYRIANTLNRHTQEFDELTPEHRDIVIGYTETLMRSAKEAELHHRRANLPFAFVVAGVVLLSLLYLMELHRKTENRGAARNDATA